MPTETEDLFRTANLHLGAFLAANGLPLLRLEENDRRKFFIFPCKQKCLELERSFLSGEGLVSGREFSNALKMLKVWVLDK